MHSAGTARAGGCAPHPARARIADVRTLTRERARCGRSGRSRWNAYVAAGAGATSGSAAQSKLSPSSGSRVAHMADLPRCPALDGYRDRVHSDPGEVESAGSFSAPPGSRPVMLPGRYGAQSVSSSQPSSRPPPDSTFLRGNVKKLRSCGAHLVVAGGWVTWVYVLGLHAVPVAGTRLGHTRPAWTAKAACSS